MVQVLPPPKPDIPEAPPGQALSVFPAGHCLWLEDYEYYDQLGRDPLQQAKIWLIDDAKERTASLEALLQRYPKQMHRNTMLYEAAKRGDAALVRRLVAAGVKVHPDIPAEELSEEDLERDEEAKENGSMPDREDPSVVPIHAAALHGHLEALSILLEEGKTDVDVLDTSGRTPLILGTKHPNIVRYLLDRGADPLARTSGLDPDLDLGDFATADALETAAAWGNVECLRLLLEHPLHGSTTGEKSRAGTEPGVRVTPLALKAAAEGEGGFEALKFLLERGGYPMEAREGKSMGELLSEDQRQAIVDATPGAAADGSFESLKLLLSYQYPADAEGNVLPFEVPEQLYKPLVYGAYAGMKHNDPKRFEFIYNLGIKEHETMSLDSLPDGQRFNIQHLLDVAAEAGSIECARLMIDKYGANPNGHRMPPGIKPLFAAAGNDRPDMVRLLLEDYAADVQLASGRYATGPTALWIAISLKSLASVEHLLRHGGPVNSVDEAIRNISSPMSVVLRVNMTKTYETSVHLETRETAEEYLAKCKERWQNLNPAFVCLELGPEDREWIARLQARKSPEELRETGANARELCKEMGAKYKDLEGGDPRLYTPPIPTYTWRQEILNKDDDLIPEFQPYLVSANNDDSD
ncbi:ankyrin repeat-containing domain protein [Stachybotrys elegans]|uniref:Ankyrin repeat-containing domain protein n=1 Tax=Stachybotrys elegans TaxID=80388 RepID=A0A8K0WLC7_9HYPO|nr:ankyrin repeat-containing domain protein [Stachybotrys elegans]